MPTNHHHRSGPLKQSNKRNKRSKSSKRSLTRLAGGKVGGTRRLAFKQNVFHSKADRRHMQQQKRTSKKEELMRRKRGIVVGGGVAAPPPRVVGIVSLGQQQDELEERLRQLIVGQADRIIRPNDKSYSATLTAKFDKHKKDGNLTVLTNSTAFRPLYSNTMNASDAAVFAALDLCRVCDILVFVIDAHGQRPGDDVLGMNIGDDSRSQSTNQTSQKDWDHLISDRGDRILSAVKSQGLPRVVTILAKTQSDPGIEEDDDHMTTQSAKSLRRANIKRNTDVKKYVSRFATTEFGVDNDKVIEVNLKEEESSGMEEEKPVEQSDPRISDPEAHAKKVLAESFVRGLCSMSASPSNWVSQLPRSYLLSEKHDYDPKSQELSLTGYMRGVAPFDVNSLIHVPNLGTFACKSVQRATNSSAAARKQKSVEDTMQDQDNNAELIESDPMKRESLEQFATPDALDGEQNLVGFDEADEEFEGDDGKNSQDDTEHGGTFARPAGWSDYQSAWLDAVDDDAIDPDDFDHGELAKQLNQKSSASVATNGMDLDDANEISEEERRALVEQRRKQQQEDQEFPDEVQVNEDEKARERFARYRSLKSFKKSYWDPKENLPDSYASIFHFASFKTTQRSIMAEMRDLVKASEACNGDFWDGVKKGARAVEDVTMADDSDDEDDILEGCIPAGSYVTLTLEGVDEVSYSSLSPDALLSAVALLPHENKVSVLHMGLSNCKDSEVPVKSKDVLTFRCGWRTWTGRPVFSQNNLNCDKHKFERFMPQAGSFFAASVFGPVTYTPCPVLVFRDINGTKELVASGSMIGADADRIVVKRIILTGYPVRVHKRFASVKYMFYDPEDVKWFKPAGLTTKHGLNGKIEESVGEHGTMKCLFNAPIKQHDTVCLCLYKRIYPKFLDDRKQVDEGQTVRTISQKSALIIK
ncbi:40S ribosome biogenesis protein [Nitzschia inconspicua]|uniref:40S ribosome biogenesis protein n=1 Tax=Nitzschia inconspicua TaxID=303405 RepID=A0A9K3LMA7_9STRA|nr:40S ribosome biogenesis protein [Nitzschia inconspicua]